MLTGNHFNPPTQDMQPTTTLPSEESLPFEINFEK